MWLLASTGLIEAAADSVTGCTLDSYSRSRNCPGKVGFRGENPIVGQQQLGVVTYLPRRLLSTAMLTVGLGGGSCTGKTSIAR